MFKAPNGTYWLYGIHPVSHALQNHQRKIHHLVHTQGFDLSKIMPPDGSLTPPVTPIDKAQMIKYVGPDAVHQGVALCVTPLPPKDMTDLEDISAPQQLVMVLDQVTDPHNVGAILRTCAVFNVTALILTDRHAPKESGILAKAACGALEYVPIITLTNLSAGLTSLKKQGFWTVGLDERGQETLSELNWKGKMAIIMGAEGDGMRRLTKTHCDHLVRLESATHFSTLNVSNAAAITLYEGFKGQK